MSEPTSSAPMTPRPQTGVETELFPTRVPPWVARSWGWFLILVFVAALLMALILRMPETLQCPFVLVSQDGKVVAQLSVPEEALAEIRPGLPVKLLFKAFPYQRYGARNGTVQAVNPTVITAPEGQILHATTQLAEQSIAAGGISHPLRPGLSGEARVILGSRTLIEYVFDPIRRLKESLGS
jgi:hypothetical protein